VLTASLPRTENRRRWRLPAAAAVLVLGFILGLGVLFAWLRFDAGGGDRSTTGPALLAVLPFESVGDSTEAYFADGESDAVRGKLAALPGLQVIAGTSSGQYRHTAKSPQEIARELGARYLLVGKVRREVRAGDSSWVTVSTELVEAHPRGAPTTRWQEPLEAPLTDVFRVQADIARGVAEALGVALGAGARLQLAEPPTENLAAYRAFLRGEEVSNKLETIDPGTLRRALTYYEQAVALDSGFVEGWARLAEAGTSLYSNGARDPVVARRAKEAMERALQLEPDNAVAAAAAAGYYATIARDPARSADYIERAIQVAPNDPDILRTAARADVSSGNYARATARLERARELDPRNAAVLTSLSGDYLLTGRLQEAEEVASALIALQPDVVGNYHQLVKIKLAEGDLDGAKAVVARATARISPPLVAGYFAGYEELTFVLDPATRALVSRLTPSAFDGDRAWWGQSLSTYYWDLGEKALSRAYADSSLAAGLEQVRQAPNDPSLLVLYGVALAHAGQSDSAVATGRRAIAMYRTEASASVAYDRLQMVRIYLVTGRLNEAMDALENLEKQPTQVTPRWIALDPMFTPLKGNPRFESLMKGS
jgi:TolB-like protein/Flp pilus assembly protein TadD